MKTMAFWEYYFSECPSSNRGHSEKQYSHNAMVFKQGGILPIMPWFLKNSLKKLLSQKEVVKPCNNVKIPPFSSGHWNRCRPRASKTALGPRATLCGPRAVLEALGRHLFQSPSEKGGILAQNVSIFSVPSLMTPHKSTYFDIVPCERVAV